MIQMIKSPIANPIMWKQKHLLSGMVVTLGAVSLIISNLEMIASMLTKVFQIAPWESMGGALLIFGLRLTDVPIGTLKTVLMVRGVRTWATLLGLLEVTIWITAMGRVMGHLDNPWNIAGYALGYSVGTWLGMWIENRLAFGSVEVHTISLTKSTQVAETIRAAGYGKCCRLLTRTMTANHFPCVVHGNESNGIYFMDFLEQTIQMLAFCNRADDAHWSRFTKTL